MTMKLTIDGYTNKIDNKYYKIYRKLIIKRINEPISNDQYYEMHHILPKSFGGTNKRENLICLTAKEHYIAHLLLTKFISGKDRYKALNAFFCMNMKSKNTIFRYSNSRNYSKLKNELRILISEMQKRLWLNPEYKEAMRNKVKLSWESGARDEQRQYIKENSPFKNKEIHEKTIKKRTINETNVWLKNNPMKDPIKAKQIASKRSGKNHYLTKRFEYEYSLDNSKTWILLDKELTVYEICKKMNWSIATFYYILKGKIPKRGNMKNLIIRKIDNENN